MLRLTVPATELFDEENSLFISVPSEEICLEHSLVALSKWESRFSKAFLGPDHKTPDEILGYIECMIIGEFSDGIVFRLSKENLDAISDYIDSKQSATTFSERHEKTTPKARGEIITSELIYYWLSAFGIPFEPTETWHLNRLLTLVRVANVKNSKPKKKSPKDLARERWELNEKRKKELGTSG